MNERVALPRISEQLEAGKSLRGKTPRSSHGEWRIRDKGHNVVTMLEASNRSRVRALVPVRYGRMLTSPFSFLRGAAVVMAHDLSRTPASGIRVQACGDAHLMNFGGFATPERHLVFDVNDFDETLPAPWEWDVKRLAASVLVAGRHLTFSRSRCENATAAAVRAYRESIAEYSELGALEMWYQRIDAARVSEQHLFDFPDRYCVLLAYTLLTTSTVPSSFSMWRRVLTFLAASGNVKRWPCPLRLMGPTMLHWWHARAAAIGRHSASFMNGLHAWFMACF